MLIQRLSNFQGLSGHYNLPWEMIIKEKPISLNRNVCKDLPSEFFFVAFWKICRLDNFAFFWPLSKYIQWCPWEIKSAVWKYDPFFFEKKGFWYFHISKSRYAYRHVRSWGSSSGGVRGVTTITNFSQVSKSAKIWLSKSICFHWTIPN